MRTCLLVLSLLIVALTGVAQAGPIEDRQAAMKRVGALAGRDLAPFVRGDKPYDAAAVLTALQALDAEAKAFDVATLFPAGSDVGDTKVSPRIWEDPAAFQAAVDAFAADIAAAVAAAPQDVAALTPLFDKIVANCRSCHGDWRR